MTSYLGLRYPASDIPRQARRLYLRNTIRLIPDARYVPAPLVGLADRSDDAPLDLSDSVLRSVSPIHLEYLANMGVVASMSLSLVVEGRLWGLIACHHRAPRFLPTRIRAALDLFGQMASFQLETRLAAEALALRSRTKAIQETLIADLASADDIREGLQRSRQALLDYLPASGLALWIDGEFAAVGETPTRAEVAGLVAWLNESVTDGVFQTDALASYYPPAAAMSATASGVLAISVSRSPRDYLIWFRPEQVQTVRWAGDPNKPVVDGGRGARLSPRKSFADWRQEVRLRSDPWGPVDIKTAESLRVSLLEVVLEHVDQLARERQRARLQQDALLAQLDDRIAQWEKTAEQLKMESDRRALVEAELSQVLRRTVIDQEADRRRIARELHDSLGQYLTAMRMDLDRIARDETATSSIRARVERLKSLTAEAGQEVNHLAWEIRPTSLDDLGLQAAVQQFLEQWSERSPLIFDLHLTLNNRRLPPAVESTLYRVLQEAVHNVIKHANATRVGVILAATETQIGLVIEDDGEGFLPGDGAVADQPAVGLGLLGMRERLALVGGSLEIETAPGRGTTVLIHVPV
jgi:light-regulated signal transduction histidine kinase (bacteriophytochrome)